MKRVIRATSVVIDEQNEILDLIEELESMGYDTSDRGEILMGLGAGLGYDRQDQRILLRKIQEVNARRAGY